MSGWSIVARRLMLRLAIVGMVLAAVTTGLVLTVDYAREVGRVRTGLTLIEESYLGSVIENAWLEDTERLGMLVTGIQRLPSIALVEVRDQSGRILATSGTPPAGETILRTFPLVREYNGRNLTIGELSITAELSSVRERTLARGWLALASSLVLILLLSSFLYWMVHREITGRLWAVAGYARRLGEEGPAAVAPMPETGSKNPDELTDLTTAFNDMRTALESSYAEVREREARYRELFTSFPIALWEEDFSDVHAAIDAMRADIADPASHFATNPELVRALAAKVRILDLNDAAIALHRAANREELLGRLSVIFTPTSLEAFKRQLLAIWHGEDELVLESEVRTVDGDVREVMLRWFAPPTTRSDLSRVIVSTEDITERKQAERALEVTLEKLTEANTELERFAFVASHDLQEPVRSVVSFSQLLERRMSERCAADTEAAEYLGFLKAAGLRMQEQVAGLLVYSRAEQVNRPFAPVDLNAALAEALEILGDTIAESGARITAEPLPQVLGDGAQLAEVLRHLIDNGIKFRRPGSPPEIAISATHHDGQWRITVHDNGIGLDPVYAPDVFQVFRRLHGPTQYPGAGIGLATCRRIIERHGGHIWLDPASTHGAIFHFTLPAVSVGA